MSPLRPDLVDTWIFRIVPDGTAAVPDGTAAVPEAAGNGRLEILLMRRSAGRILPGLWQCVSGSLEPGERVAAGALRELDEETGIRGEAIEGFFDLDLVNQFHEPTADAVLVSAVFAVRVAPDVEPVLSHEHDAFMWLSVDEALRHSVWPGYREAIRRIAENLVDAERARWFALSLSGKRLIV